MNATATSLPTEPLTVAAALEGMADTVLLIGEWLVEAAPEKVQQVAELVEQPLYIREYHRPLYQSPKCGWSGYSSMAWGTKEGFSYGGRLCSIVGWLGYGGNLTWLNREYFVEHVLGVPSSDCFSAYGPAP